MTADDWKRVKTIASEAWARPVDERSSYIAGQCSSDDALYREVTSLVGAMAEAADRFEVPADVRFDTNGGLASLAGCRLGAYEILAPLGAGGMGEVYKARDTRLDRMVAIKVLPVGAGADPAARERLEREARAVAALRHPHICTLYDIGSQDGLDFLVMEFLSGETLAARLSRGRLPVAEALQYAEQIASALTEAHRAGIVHRDVKPANIILDQSGLHSAGAPAAKLLDFGLAKANPSETPSPGTLLALGAPTDVTVEGFAPGTAQYMAPEQLDRSSPDARSDIFAFGAVLFEMLTGRKAFEGTSRAEVLAAIRDKEPPSVSSLRPSIPAALDRMVAKCLARAANDRYQSIGDLLVDVRALRRRLEPSSTVWRLASISTVAALVIAGIAAWTMWGRSVGPTVAPTVTRLPGTDRVLGAPSLSPDGSSVVVSWGGADVDNPELVLLEIGSRTRVRLTNDAGIEEWPTWSPDGTRIGFVRCAPDACGIFILPIGGGSERKVRDLRHDRYYGLAWSPDGRHIAYAERVSPSAPYELFLLALDTLVTRQLSSPSRSSGDLRFAFSPDGSTLAVIRLGDGNGIGVFLLPLNGEKEKVLLKGQQEWFGGVTWSADGRHLILSANQQGIRRLWKLPVSGGALEEIAIAGEDSYFPSVSADGTRLAFVHDLRDWDLTRLALDRGHVRASAPFLTSPRIDLDPAFSPDGRRLAFVSERSGTREVWVSNADGSDARQITSMQGPPAGKPSWSPDGHMLAFHASGIHVMPSAGGPPRRLTEDGEMPSWSANGKWIYFRLSSGGRFHIWRVPAEGGSPIQAIRSEASAAREDPSGVTLYFTRTQGGIWRCPIGGDEESAVIEDFSWSLPGYWNVFDDGIYYVARELLSDRTVANQLRFLDFASNRTVDVGTLTGGIDDWVGGLTVLPDRQTVLYSQRTYESSEIVVVDHVR